MQYTDPAVERRTAELDALEQLAAADARRRALGMTKSEFMRFEADELDQMRRQLASRPAPGQSARTARRAAMGGGLETRPQQRPPAAGASR
jgi:hypothetical protein